MSQLYVFKQWREIVDGRQNISSIINCKDTILDSGVPWQSLLGKFYSVHTFVHVSKHPLSVTLFFIGINFLTVLNIILQSHERYENAAVKPSRNVSQARRGLIDTRVCYPRSQKEQVLLENEDFYGNGEKLWYSCLSSHLLICSSLWLAQSLSLFLNMGRDNLLTIQPSTLSSVDLVLMLSGWQGP